MFSRLLQGTQWKDMNGWTKGSEEKCKVHVWSVRGWWLGTTERLLLSSTHAKAHSTHTHYKSLHDASIRHTHTHACTYNSTNLLVPAPPLSSSQLTAVLDSLLHQWPPHNTPSDCPQWRDMSSDGTYKDLMCVFGVGGVNAWLDIFRDDIFTIKPKQTQSGVNDLKKFCLMFLEKLWYWKFCICKSQQMNTQCTRPVQQMCFVQCCAIILRSMVVFTPKDW